MKNSIFITLAIAGSVVIIGGGSYFLIKTKGTNQNQTQNQIQNQKEQNVPLPQEEDVIRTFVNLIEEGEADKAVSMMTLEDDTQK